MIIPRREREMAGRAAKREDAPRRRVMLRLYSEGRSVAEIAEELHKQGLLVVSDEKKVKDELKVCLDRQKAREKNAMSGPPPSAPEGTTSQGAN